jgi:hypothetical protein
MRCDCVGTNALFKSEIIRGLVHCIKVRNWVCASGTYWHCWSGRKRVTGANSNHTSFQIEVRNFISTQPIHMPASAASSARALNAILPLISSGQPYEAHQKARTFASRYTKSSQYDTAIDVLFQSAKELLKAGQQGSGVDLAGFLLDVYESKGEGVSEESRGRVLFSCNRWHEGLIDFCVGDRKIDAAHCVDWIVWVVAQDDY